ncbi:Ulp1 protease family, C-terminal catalytic domain [Popillia japonica]|uniref:Ulp1 protease family, C-terminal catalytic domain n=1 Tax=Popillia japonica TaxID=7064 RepID=A0AAW1M579_POPJA
MDGNQVILNYHESLLRGSDMRLLQGPSWLNDTIISFYFEYLEIDKFKKNPALLFVPPQVTQCIKITPMQDIGIFLDPLRMESQNFIFFALNDNEQTECSGGTHWSLLVLSHPEKTVFHFDSSRGANQDQAIELGEKLLNYYDLSSFGSFSEPRALQQTNGYDCGIHVLCNVENIAHYALRFKKIEGCPLPDKESVYFKRREILDLIHKLRHLR